MACRIGSKWLATLIVVVMLASTYTAQAADYSMVHVVAPIRYGGNSTNAEMVAHNGATYVAYADTDFTLTVARRNDTTGVWTKATQIDQTLGENDPSHNQIALAVDGDGYVHVWYGMHDKEGMRYARSNRPDDVASGFTIRGDEFPTPSGSYTYPHAVTAPNGDLYFSIRLQGRQLPLYRWDNATDVWQLVAVVAAGDSLFNKGATFTPYLPWLYVDAVGNVHIKWDWAFVWSRNERHLGSYALYNPTSGRFYRADGTLYDMLPITPDSADVFQPMPTGVTEDEEGIALSDMMVDSFNRPVISYAFSPDGSADHWEHRVAHWNGTQWVQTVLTDQTRKWNKNFLLADGSLLYYYAKTLNGTELWTSADQGTTWSAAQLIYNRPLDGAAALASGQHVLLHLSADGSATDSELTYLSFTLPVAP